MKTTTLPPQAPAWYLVDVEGKTLGRVTSRIASLLRGKHKPSFAPHQLCGDHIVVVNAAKLSVPQAKWRRKVFFKHTGYPGGLRMRTLREMMEQRPTEVILHAVRGMLPNSRLRPGMLKRLHVYPGSEHPFAAQKPSPLSLS